MIVFTKFTGGWIYLSYLSLNKKFQIIQVHFIISPVKLLKLVHNIKGKIKGTSVATSPTGGFGHLTLKQCSTL